MTRNPPGPTLAPLPLLFLLAAFVALAARTGAQSADPIAPSPLFPPDIVEIVSGDRISGIITHYSEGDLTVDTKHEGYVSIKWSKIVSIRSAREFEVQLPDGEYLFGSLEPSDPPGKMAIVSASGRIVMPFIEVVSITPIYQTFFGRIDGSFDLGLNYTAASELFQVNTALDATYKKPKFELDTSFSAFYSTQNGDTQSERGNLGFDYYKFLRRRWVWGSLLSFDSNRDQGLKLRESLGIFVGRRLLLSNQAAMILVAGFQGTNEKATTNNSTQAIAGYVQWRYKTFTYDFPRFWFEAYVQFLPGITDAPRYRVNSEIKAKREIIRKFSVSLSVFYNYDSIPPAANAQKTDWGPIVGVSWTF